MRSDRYLLWVVFATSALGISSSKRVVSAPAPVVRGRGRSELSSRLGPRTTMMPPPPPPPPSPPLAVGGALKRKVTTALLGSSVFGAGSLVLQIPVLHDLAIAKSLDLTTQQITVSSSVIFFAWALGATILGRLSDTAGRKVVAVTSATLVMAHLAMTAAATSYGALVVARLLGGFAMGGLYAGFTLGVENAPPDRRSETASALNAAFTSTVLALVVVHWVCKRLALHWRAEVATLGALLGAAVATVSVLVEESADFASSKGDPNPHRETAHFSDLARPANRFPFAVLVATLIASSVAYYALSFQAGVIPGSLEFNIFILAACDLPGYRFADWLSHHYARGALPLSFVACAACLSGVAAAASLGCHTAAKYLAFGGKLCCSAAFQLVYLLPNEHFDPAIRSTAFGVASSVARLASCAIPALAALPFAVASAISAVSALAAAGLAARLGEKKTTEKKNIGDLDLRHRDS